MRMPEGPQRRALGLPARLRSSLHTLVHAMFSETRLPFSKTASTKIFQTNFSDLPWGPYPEILPSQIFLGLQLEFSAAPPENAISPPAALGFSAVAFSYTENSAFRYTSGEESLNRQWQARFPLFTPIRSSLGEYLCSLPSRRAACFPQPSVLSVCSVVQPRGPARVCLAPPR